MSPERLLEMSRDLGGPLLAIESSSRQTSACAIGLTPEGVVEDLLGARQRASEALGDVLNRWGGDRGFSELRAIVVGLGPGSFTGLRVGLAMAKGIALAADVPIVGTSSLAMLAAQVGPGRVGVAQDARRGELFSAVFDVSNDGRAVPIVADGARTPAQARALFIEQEVERVVGDAAAETFDGDVREDCSPSARHALWNAYPRLKNRDYDDVETLLPRYMRVSEAQRQMGEQA